MALIWTDFVRLLADEPLPAAIVDLDAVDRNVDRTLERIDGTGKTLRVASKSVRHVGLLRRILARGAPDFAGLMCFTAEEAGFLADEGFDDLLVAYPTVRIRALAEIARIAAAGKRVSNVVDCREHVEALASAGRTAQVDLAAIIEVDVSYRALGGHIHLGTRRSPIRSAAAAVEVARLVRDTPGVKLGGVMGYESHVAGLPDENPFSKSMNPVRKALKRVAQPDVGRIRREVVDALVEDGHEVALVNGGGTGSLHDTARERCVTEVTAGSGFLDPHLFDYYAAFDLEPAAWFALEVVRQSDPGFVTCAGGGYVASGEPGWDRLPLPWLPEGLRYVGIEGAGEVQTPLSVAPGSPDIAIGDPIVFRHAKAGELAEHFPHYLLLRGDAPTAREPTYRGQGRRFL